MRVGAYFSIAECSRSGTPVKLNPVPDVLSTKTPAPRCSAKTSEKFCFSEQLKEHL